MGIVNDHSQPKSELVWAVLPAACKLHEGQELFTTARYGIIGWATTLSTILPSTLEHLIGR
jgi:hypothetical protein